MKSVLLCLLLLGARVAYSNESSTQWFIQPLKIKHQVGKDQMTEAALYRFPVFMYSTHMTGPMNNITAPNKLEHLTPVKGKAVLKNFNLANLYGVSVHYDISDDVTRIDLTHAKKPKVETIPLDDVIAMTLECVRLSWANDHTFILTNESTKKWKGMEKALLGQTPLYTVKTVPLKVTDSDLLYHWAYWPDPVVDEQSEPTRFPAYGGKPEAHDKSHTSYQGIGFSYPLSVYSFYRGNRDVELNPLAGYTFNKQDGFIVIKSPAKPREDEQKRDAFALMKRAVECLVLSVDANGEKGVYQLKISDLRLTKEQCAELITLW